MITFEEELTVDKSLEKKLYIFQYEIRMYICKALTYEILAQYDNSFDMYNKAILRVKKLSSVLDEAIIDGKLNKSKNTETCLKHLKEIKDNLRSRSSDAIKLWELYSEFQSRIMLQDLGVIAKNFGGTRLQDFRTSKEINKERFINRKPLSKRSTLSNEDSLVKALTKNVFIENSAKSENMFAEIERPQSSYSKGKISELFSINVPRTFQINQGNVYHLEDDCKLLILMYEELNTSSKALRYYPVHYLVVGSSFYPLIKNTTFVYKMENFYIFPDFFEDTKNVFVGFEISTNDSQFLSLQEILRSLNVFKNEEKQEEEPIVEHISHVLIEEPEEVTKHKCWKKVATFLRNALDGFKDFFRLPDMTEPYLFTDGLDLQTDAKSILKIKCLGEIVSGLGLLLPKFNFKVEKKDLIAEPFCSGISENDLVESAWDRVLESKHKAYQIEELSSNSQNMSFEKKIHLAIGCLRKWKETDDNKKRDTSDATSFARMTGFCDALVKCALITFYLSKMKIKNN